MSPNALRDVDDERDSADLLACQRARYILVLHIGQQGRVGPRVIYGPGLQLNDGSVTKQTLY